MTFTRIKNEGFGIAGNQTRESENPTSERSDKFARESQEGHSQLLRRHRKYL